MTMDEYDTEKSYDVAAYVTVRYRMMRRGNSVGKSLIPTFFASAYLRDYSPEWPGYNKVTAKAPSGVVAKKRAIAEIKRRPGERDATVNMWEEQP